MYALSIFLPFQYAISGSYSLPSMLGSHHHTHTFDTLLRIPAPPSHFTLIHIYIITKFISLTTISYSFLPLQHMPT